MQCNYSITVNCAITVIAVHAIIVAVADCKFLVTGLDHLYCHLRDDHEIVLPAVERKTFATVTGMVFFHTRVMLINC